MPLIYQQSVLLVFFDLSVPIIVGSTRICSWFRTSHFSLYDYQRLYYVYTDLSLMCPILIVIFITSLICNSIHHVRAFTTCKRNMFFPHLLPVTILSAVIIDALPSCLHLPQLCHTIHTIHYSFLTLSYSLLVSTNILLSFATCVRCNFFCI